MRWCLLVLLAALTPSSASATTVVRLDLDGKLARAAAVIHGQVERVASSVDPVSGLISSQITIRVFESFRGPFEAGERFELWRAGGTVDGVTEWIPGLHRYAIGDEVVVLAERASVGWVAIGVGIGTLVIHRPPGCPEGAGHCGEVVARPRVETVDAHGVPASAEPPTGSWPELRARLRSAPFEAQTPPELVPAAGN